MLGKTLVRRLRQFPLLVVETDVVGLDKDCVGMDITSLAEVDQFVSRLKPDVVIHCAAKTNVDACESDPDSAYHINTLGTSNVAVSCFRHSARLVYISTDYVFSGLAPESFSYVEWDDDLHPNTVYGKSKLAGERAVQSLCPDHTILRTAWLYGENGPSFYHTMLRLAKEGKPIKVVNDQRGNPTSTSAMTTAIVSLLELPTAGIVHASCEGTATWYEFAQEIFRLHNLTPELSPCTTAEYPRPAPRPENSSLKKSVLTMPNWKLALKMFVEEQNAQS